MEGTDDARWTPVKDVDGDSDKSRFGDDGESGPLRPVIGVPPLREEDSDGDDTVVNASSFSAV